MKSGKDKKKKEPQVVQLAPSSIPDQITIGDIHLSSDCLNCEALTKIALGILITPEFKEYLDLKKSENQRLSGRSFVG